MTSHCIAVLMTCHNRRDLTLECLERLFISTSQEELDVFVVDDGSTDGTGAAIRSRFPLVHVIEGNGELYWVGGMRLAFEHASNRPHDFMLWLNDDVALFPDGVSTLVATWEELSKRGRDSSIVVGAVVDPATGLTAYSGVTRPTHNRPTRFSMVEPASEAQPCDTFNGNVVLVPEVVTRRVGNLDGAFTHSMADTDYGLRARAHGCNAWVAPGWIGTCSLNHAKDRWRSSDTPVLERIRIVLGPKGLPPREWLTFTRRHAGRWWPLFWVSPYVNALARPRASAV